MPATQISLLRVHRVVHSILATRLILNIRRAAAPPSGLTEQFEMMHLERSLAFTQAERSHEDSLSTIAGWERYGQ